MVLLFVATIVLIYVVATKLRYKLLKTQYEALLNARAHTTLKGLITENRIKVHNIESYPQTKGIYMYQHKRSGKCYIGKSLNMQRRAKQHFSDSSKATVDVHFKRCRDYNFYILEELKPSATAKDLHQAERFWINVYVYTGVSLLNSTL